LITSLTSLDGHPHRLSSPRPTDCKLRHSRRLVTASVHLLSGVPLPFVRFARLASVREPLNSASSFSQQQSSSQSSTTTSSLSHSRYHERLTDKLHIDVVLSDIPRGLPQCHGSLLRSALLRKQHSNHGPMLRWLPSLSIPLR
jgi:hypothetical protein